MSKYTVVEGDTYDLVSRKVYGEEGQAARIRAANSGFVEPLAPGAVLFIPPEIGLPTAAALGTQDEELVEILIDGERFKFFESITIQRAIDTQDAIGFTAPFDPDSPEFRNTFKPFSYSNIDVLVGGKRLFAGVLIGIEPSVTEKRKAVHVSGYSRPGVLFDCTAPASSFPLEFDGQTVGQIAVSLCNTFGLGVVEASESGPVFDRAALKAGKKIGPFLADLTRQRGQVLSSTTEGQLLIQTSIAPGAPVAVLEEGMAPVESVTPNFKSQEYYSSVTGLSPVSLTSDGEQFTEQNNFLSGVLRPLTFEAKDTETGNVKAATEAKIGRMFGQVVSYTLDVPTWRDPNGELWEPNTTIKLLAPGAMIYSSYEFLIREVKYKRVADRETASLDLVFPGSYSGQKPESLPWD